MNADSKPSSSLEAKWRCFALYFTPNSAIPVAQ
jgi:predicted nucleotidyltransferase